MPEVSLESTIEISGDVVARDLDGESVILDLRASTYFGLDEVGTRIWNLLNEDGSLRRTLEVLCKEYDVPAQVLEQDLVRLVTELRDKGLVHVRAVAADAEPR